MNDFDLWNILKQKIDARKNSYAPYAKEGDVWMTSLGQNIGFEETGKGVNFHRPVLVVRKFSNDMVWICPLSSKQKKLHFYYNFIDPYKQRNAVILAQLRLISTKRLNRKIYHFSLTKLGVIKSLLKNYL